MSTPLNEEERARLLHHLYATPEVASLARRLLNERDALVYERDDLALALRGLLDATEYTCLGCERNGMVESFYRRSEAARLLMGR